MSKTDKLRDALDGWTHCGLLVFDPDVAAAQDIAASICDELGITRDHVEEVRVVHLLKMEPAENIGAFWAGVGEALLEVAGR